jgi:hypothetical protein
MFCVLFLDCNDISIVWVLILCWVFYREVVVQIMLMIIKKISSGHHGCIHFSKQAFLFNASFILMLTRVNAICIAWIAWTVPFVLFVSHTTKTIELSRYLCARVKDFIHCLVKSNHEALVFYPKKLLARATMFLISSYPKTTWILCCFHDQWHEPDLWWFNPKSMALFLFFFPKKATGAWFLCYSLIKLITLLL